MELQPTISCGILAIAGHSQDPYELEVTINDEPFYEHRLFSHTIADVSSFGEHIAKNGSIIQVSKRIGEAVVPLLTLEAPTSDKPLSYFVSYNPTEDSISHSLNSLPTAKKSFSSVKPPLTAMRPAPLPFVFLSAPPVGIGPTSVEKHLKPTMDLNKLRIRAKPVNIKYDPLNPIRIVPPYSYRLNNTPPLYPSYYPSSLNLTKCKKGGGSKRPYSGFEE